MPAEPIRDSRRKAAEPVRLCPAPGKPEGKPCEAYWSGSVDLPNCTQSTQKYMALVPYEYATALNAFRATEV